MNHLLTLDGWSRTDLLGIFDRAAQFAAPHEAVADPASPRGGTPCPGTFSGAVAMFFPPTSVRTRVSFERGAGQMGLQPIVFPPETLDKDEDLADVAGYLAQWVDLLVVRHPDMTVLERLAAADAVPVVNAMTSVNHPCEVLSDLFALSREADPFGLRYLVVGADGNITRAWWEAGCAFGLDIRQCCPAELATPGMPWDGDLARAIGHADVVVTDAPGQYADQLAPFRVTADLLDTAPEGVRFAPCPPFVRGREVSADAIAHRAFVGYEFKRYLQPVQQAVMAWALESRG